jgi:hypothetical protein
MYRKTEHCHFSDTGTCTPTAAGTPTPTCDEPILVLLLLLLLLLLLDECSPDWLATSACVPPPVASQTGEHSSKIYLLQIDLG